MCWQSEYLSQSIGGGGGANRFLGGGIREGCGIHTWPKKPKMAHITDYLPADASADAPCRINIRFYITTHHHHQHPQELNVGNISAVTRPIFTKL